jgi:hypothetical protein
MVEISIKAEEIANILHLPITNSLLLSPLSYFFFLYLVFFITIIFPAPIRLLMFLFVSVLKDFIRFLNQF